MPIKPATQPLSRQEQESSADIGPSSAPFPRWWSRPLLFRLLLLAVIALAFGRILLNNFVDWDDGPLIYLNDTMKPPLTLSKLAQQWSPSCPRNYHLYDPLVFTAWWVMAQFAQATSSDKVLGSNLNPPFFHAASLLVHWLNACIVLEILRRLRFPLLPAAGGALIFALHPLQTEAVAWATAMKDLLSGFFSLLAIWRYTISTDPAATKKFKRNYLLATLFFALALLSKPSTVVVPLLAAAIDLFVHKTSWRRTALLLLPWIAGSIVITLISASVQSADPIAYVPLWQRPFIAADALAFYFYKLLLPIHLSADYGRYPAAVIHDDALHHAIYWTWIFPLAAAVLIWRCREPMLRLAGLVFLLGVLPVLGLFQFAFQAYSTVADRYVYLSMLGIAILVALALANFTNRRVILGFCFVLFGYGTMSYTQAGIWHNTTTLYENTTSLNKTHAIDYWTLGEYYDRLGRAGLDQSNQDLQSNHLDAAQGDIAQAHAWLRRAIDRIAIAIHYDPRRPQPYRTIITDQLLLNQDQDAILWMHRLIDIQPQLDPQSRQPLVSTHAGIAMALFRLGRFDEAADELRQNPQSIDFLRKSFKASPKPGAQQWLNENFPLSQTQPAAQTSE